jgi:hypothetical protein
LFPHAAEDVIEWGAEGWSCDHDRFEDLMCGPTFRFRRDEESRFYRAMFFHFRQRRVLASLDAYLTREQNRAHPDARIGGVMLRAFESRIPLPGTQEPRYQRLPSGCGRRFR